MLPASKAKFWGSERCELPEHLRSPLGGRDQQIQPNLSQNKTKQNERKCLPLLQGGKVSPFTRTRVTPCSGPPFRPHGFAATHHVMVRGRVDTALQPPSTVFLILLTLNKSVGPSLKRFLGPRKSSTVVHKPHP